MINTNELLPGALLQNRRYEIVRKVGGGGMGVVYEAIDANLGYRRVAIKAMKRPGSTGQAGLDIQNAVRLFKQEAAILSTLNHPNLPHVYDSFEEQGVYYLVMDFIDGETLSHKLRSGRPLPFEEVISYAIQLCDILDYLHRQHPQVIFRDLKPANVIVNLGRVYLVDFGIARHFKLLNTSDTIPMGTEGYSDPEISQLKQSSPRSDLYSLGATLHHCLTGKEPRYADQGHRFPPVRNYNGSVPAALDQLILKMVEAQSRRRPYSAKQVKQQLVAILDGIRNMASNATVTGPVDPNAPTVFEYRNPPTQPVPAFASLLASFQNAFPQIADIYTRIAAFFMSTWLWSGWWYSPIWQPRFLALLGVLLTLMISASIYLFHAFHNSYYVVDLCLSLFLLFIVLPVYRAMSQKEFIPRNILAGTGIAILISLFGQVLLPLIGGPASAPAHATSALPTSSQLIAWLLLLLALLSLVSGFITSLSQAYIQSTNWYGWIDRLMLFALVASWIGLQYASGGTEHLPLFSNTSYPLSTAIVSGIDVPGIRSITVNLLICILLVPFAFILLLRPKNKITIVDRLLFIPAMLPYLLLQWMDGPAELMHFLPATQLISATAFDVILVLMLVIALFVLQRPEPDRFDLLDRGVLLLIILASVSFQNYLSGITGMRKSFLALHIPAFTLSFILPVVLILATLLLVLRLRRAVGVFDRVIVSITAFVCMLLEFASGQQGLRGLNHPVTGADPAQSIELAYLHQTLGGILLLLVLAATALAIGCAILPALRNNQQQNDRAAAILRWVDRTTLIVCGMATLLLLFTYMWQGQMLPYFQQPSALFNAIAQGYFLYLPGLFGLILAFLLLCSLLIQLTGFSRPVERKDRIIVLISLLICLLLLFGNKDVPRLPLLATGIQHLTSGWPGLLSPATFSVLGILAAALISLCWSFRPFKGVDRAVLCALFLIAAAFALFQFGHTQLFIALLVLIIGLVIALQIERVRLGTKII